MNKFGSLIVVVLWGLTLSGCAGWPYSTRHATPIKFNPPAPPRTTASPAPPTTPSQPGPPDMRAVMAELRQLGAVDPAAQDRLLEDLRQNDPSLWPLMMQQFRATVAYRQRAMQRAAATASPNRLPNVQQVAVAPTEPPAARCPGAAEPVVELPPVDEAPPSQVVQASYTAAEKGTGPICRNGPRPTFGRCPAAHKLDLSPFSPDWRRQLAGAIESLEAEVPQSPATPAEVAEHARLRMLYAAAGRREDAARPIPSATPASQQFLSKELEGLTAWLDAERTPDAARRAAETRPILAEALEKLAESAPLAIRNMAFCTEIQSYGCMKRLAKYEFQPNQELLLYAEVENFASESTPKGYHTALRSRYRILDQRGQTVAEQSFAATEEYCQNVRRDFFIGYHLRLPKEIVPGKYSLQLSIEDMKRQKAGQASVEFEALEADR